MQFLVKHTVCKMLF